MKKYEEGTVDFILHNETDIKPRLLLHACCGPCATSVLERIHDFFDVTIYFYNPNIMPKEEFNKRLCALKDVISHFNGIKLIVPDQDENDYISLVKGFENAPEGGSRCGICFEMRLANTAKYLAEHKNEYDCFATTLTVSPHKNAKLINEIGNRIAIAYNVEYLSSDFKKQDGYLRSTQLCKEWGIYRQSYCGCVYAQENQR